MDEIKKRLKEHYLQLKREHGWSKDEMALNMKSSCNHNRNIKKGNKGRFFKGRCNHCGKYWHKKADCWDLKNKQENSQENERKVQKAKSKLRCFKCKKLGHYTNECKSEKGKCGDEQPVTFAMMCYENSEEEKYENGEEENKQESKNPDDKEKVDPGIERYTEEPQGIPLMQLCIRDVIMTGITSDWAMSTIEDNVAPPRDQSSVQAWRETSTHGQEEKS